MRLDDGGLVELASGIDALYLSGRAELSRALLADLARWREAAADQEAPLAVVLGHEPVLVSARNLGRYPYRVQHQHGLVGFTDSASLPAVTVQPLSEHLHAVGPAAALAWWADWLNFLTGGVRLTASRLDVYADWQGWNLDVGHGPRFVCRANVKVTREEGQSFTGFRFDGAQDQDRDGAHL